MLYGERSDLIISHGLKTGMNVGDGSFWFVVQPKKHTDGALPYQIMPDRTVCFPVDPDLKHA